MDLLSPSFHRAFFNFINHPNTGDAEIKRWRELLPPEVTAPEEKTDGKPATPSEPLKPYLPRIDADDLKGDDHLDITPEVQAFASIMSASNVKTPLSIGLFGDWGSGKSFFMSKLKEEVNRIASAVREKPGEPTAYYGNIVQIEFNAWHYVEANLWASLVSHVFENLSFSEEEDREKAEERKQLLLAQLDTTLKAQTEAKTAVAEKNQALEAKERALTDARTELERKKSELKTEKNELEEKKAAQETARVSLRQLIRKGVWSRVKRNAEVEKHLAAAEDLLKLKGLPASERELKAELAATQTVVGRAQVMFWSIVNDPRGWQKALWLVAALILIPLLTTLVLSWMKTGEGWKSFSAWVANVLTLLAGAYKWLKPQIQKASKALDELEAANRELGDLYKSARDEFAADVESHQAAIENKKIEVEQSRAEVERRKEEIGEARLKLEEAQKAVDATRKEVEETKAALREMEPGRMLARFIQDRASSSDYRQHLGIIALIRQDFKKLSELLVGQNNDELKKAVAAMLKKHDAEGNGDSAQGGDEKLDEKLKEYKIDRIILYIDDLDRCPPKQVVDVLQAIHLLLAFELFVVVVGVDARWVRHSLKKQFPDLLSQDPEEAEEHALIKTASPRDYVEKIFQVPFWLKPMGQDASTKLLNGLIPEQDILAASPPGAAQASTQSPQPPGAPVGGAASESEDADDASETFAGGMASESGASSGPATDGGKASPSESEQATVGDGASMPRAEAFAKKDAPVELQPEGLKLAAKEKKAMMALARVIGRTPRTLKRFVNVYRIIKAGLTDEKFYSFKGAGDADGEFRAVLVLLSVSHGSPEVAPFSSESSKERHEQSSGDEKGIGLKAFLAELKVLPQEDVPEGWNLIIEELSEFAYGYEDDIPLSVLRNWAPTVVRYTFQLGRMSEVV
ncbi:MAG TPA: P-loop NTPase fold protein [Pyrinomonadaceae bacterium]|nr:P-loop NTPase fold protein [Pyrinomonadaceae bacterium]